MIKILLIDVGLIKTSIKALFGLTVLIELPAPRHNRTLFENRHHISFVAQSFANEYGLGKTKNIELHACGLSFNFLEEQYFDECVEYAIKNKIKYINVSFQSSTQPMPKEYSIIKKAMDNGIIMVFSHGNRPNADPNNLYPNKYCKEFENCYIAYYTEGNMKVTEGSIGLPSKTCIDEQCMMGSSFAAPKLLAKIIKGEIKKEKK